MTKSKKHKIILILIVVGVIAGVVIMCFFFRANKDKYILDGPGMVNDPTQYIFYCSYYSGGGMENSYERYEIEEDEYHVITITHTVKKSDEPNEKTESRTVSYDAIIDIRNIYREKGVMDWTDLPETDLMLDDAPTTSITIRFRDNFLTIKDTHILPEEGKGFFTEIYNVLETNFNQGVD